jgi:hypothetical protein
LNYNLQWTLESPTKEIVFGFQNSYNGLFLDPSFDQENLVDWTNDGYTSAYVNTTGSKNMLLNLTSGSGTAEIYLTKDIPLSGDFEISFLYSNETATNPLSFSYYNNGWQNISLSGDSDNSFDTFSDDITLSGGEPGTNKVLRFVLDAPTSDFAIWLLDSFSINYNQDHVVIEPNEETVGTVSQYWYNQGLDTLITADFETIEKVVAQTSSVNITFNLPQDKIYLGDWVLNIIVQTKAEDDTINPEVIYPVAIRIEDDFYFEVEETYLLRGENTTSDTSMYENETGKNTIFSPTDNISYIGLLYYNSSSYPINSSYYSQIQGFLSHTFTSELLNLSWGIDDGYSYFRYSNNEALDVAHGNLTGLTLTEDISNYFVINTKIPERGIFGSVTKELQLFFPTEQEVTIINETITEPINYIYSMPEITVKYRITLENEKLPQAEAYYLLDTISGQYRITTQHYNTSLLAVYTETNREFDLSINIPFEDMELELQFYSSDLGVIEYSEFRELREEMFVYWKYTISPRTDVSKQYSLRLKWLNAELNSDEDLMFVKHESGNVNFNIKVVGAFDVFLSQDVKKVYQYEEVEFKFSVVLDHNNLELVEVPLYALLDDEAGSSKVIIGYEGSQYRLVYSPDEAVAPGYHTLAIYTELGYYLGSVTIEVQPKQTTPGSITYINPILVDLIGLIGLAVVMASFALGLLVVLRKY